MPETQASITHTIIETINNIFSSLFSSVDNNLYSILDDIVFIKSDILKDKFINSIFGTPTTSGLLLISNSLLIGFALYYIIRYACSHYIFYSNISCAKYLHLHEEQEPLFHNCMHPLIHVIFSNPLCENLLQELYFYSTLRTPKKQISLIP